MPAPAPNSFAYVTAVCGTGPSAPSSKYLCDSSDSSACVGATISVPGGAPVSTVWVFPLPATPVTSTFPSVPATEKCSAANGVMVEASSGGSGCENVRPESSGGGSTAGAPSGTPAHSRTRPHDAHTPGASSPSPSTQSAGGAGPALPVTTGTSCGRTPLRPRARNGSHGCPHI